MSPKRNLISNTEFSKHIFKYKLTKDIRFFYSKQLKIKENAYNIISIKVKIDFSEKNIL